MHHGTILFSADFEGLTRSLNPSKIKVESKGIKSVRARVTNVSEHLKTPIDINEFKAGLKNKFLKDCVEYEFAKTDILAINKLVKEKYSQYDWNIARSPKGKNSFTHKFPFGIFTLNFDVEKGVITNAQIFGDFFELKPSALLCEKLNGIKFEKKDVEKALEKAGEFILGASGKEIVEKLFIE